MTKNQGAIVAKKAKWESPELNELDAGLTNIQSAASPGTDSLMFGGSTSQS